MPGALEDVPDRAPDVPMSVVGRNSVQVDRAMIFAHRFGSDQNMWRWSLQRRLRAPFQS